MNIAVKKKNIWVWVVSILIVVFIVMGIFATATFSSAENIKKAESPVIALIDTGISVNQKVVGAVSIIGDDPYDDNGHGTKMYDTIRGVDPDAQILSIKALDADGVGTPEALSEAISYAVENGADIINLSMSASVDESNKEFGEAIEKATKDGIKVVAAAGNHGENASDYLPGAIIGAITVGSSDENGKISNISNYGDCVDYYITSESTSEAAAITSGILSKGEYLEQSNLVHKNIGQISQTELHIEKDSRITVAATYTMTLKFHINGGAASKSTVSTDQKTETAYRVSNNLIQTRKRTRTSATASWGSWSSWADYTTTVNTSATYKDLINVSTFGGTRTGYHITGTQAYRTTATGGTLISQQNTSTDTTNPATTKRINNGTQITSNVTKTLYVNWIANTYTVTYNGNGNTGGSTANSSHTYNSAKALTSNGYTKTGYTFAGWATSQANADAGSVAHTNGKSVTNLTSTNGDTVTLFAVWTPNTYTVHYDGNGATGGTTVDSSHVYNVEKALSENGYVKTGYTFKGWSLEQQNFDYPSGSQSGNIDYVDKESIVNLTSENKETVTLYASWQLNMYNIKYYLEDPETGVYKIKDNLGKYIDFENIGEPRIISPQYQYEHYITPPAQDITIDINGNTVVRFDYALEKCKISFDGNGADSGYMRTVMANFIQGYSAPENLFKKTGSHFVFWNTEADGSGTTYKPGQNITNDLAVGDVITLYAQWAEYENAESISNGIMHVTARQGQEVVIPELPAGMTYSVEEVNIPNGWKLQSSENTSGTIQANADSQVSFINEYHAEGQATIEAYKTLRNAALTKGQFAFQLLDSGGNVISVATNGQLDTEETLYDDEGVSYANPLYNTATVMFSDLQYTQEGIYTYTVKETVGDDENIIYDTHEETVTVVVTDNGDGTLRTEVQYDDDGAFFVNDVKPSNGGLSIKKLTENTTDASKDQEFQFQITFEDINGNALQGKFPYYAQQPDSDDAAELEESNADGMIGNNDIISLKGGEQILISGLPVGATYSVQELPIDGWELVRSSNSSGTIQEDNITAEFTNVYSTMGSAQIEAEKVYNGGKIPENYFKFELRNGAGEVLTEAYAQEDGSVVFDPIDYTTADDGKTFYYYISEVVPEVSDGITYDTSVKEVAVSVNDNGHGVLETEVTYDSNGMVFTNGGYTELSISKTVQGNGSKAEKFDFKLELTNANDTPYLDTVEEPEDVDSWTSLGGGVYTFKLGHGDSISIPLPNGIKYKITEDPKEFKNAVEIKQGGKKIDNEAESPVAQGVIESSEGDVDVKYINSLYVVVPTGVTTSVIPGIAVVLLGVTAFIVVKRKKRTTENPA